MARHYMYLITLLVLAVIAMTPSLHACFDPMDTFSGEVLLNKPGITYDLSILDGVEDVVKLDDNTYMYRSHVGEAVVIVYLEDLVNGVPVWGKQEPTSYCIGVRVELMNMSLDQATSVDDIMEYRENATLWLRNIMGYELEWLIGIGVVTGLVDSDIDSILSTLESGYAGWNSRLVYYSGDSRWHPYNELVHNNLIQGELLRGSSGCRWFIPEDKVPSEPPKATPTHSSAGTLSSVVETETTSRVGGFDGLALAIALIVGLTAAIITLLILRR